MISTCNVVRWDKNVKTTLQEGVLGKGVAGFTYESRVGDDAEGQGLPVEMWMIDKKEWAAVNSPLLCLLPLTMPSDTPQIVPG